MKWGLLVLMFAFVSSDGASRSEKEKIQVVYTEKVNGEWRLHIFGPYCQSNMVMKMTQPKDPYEPVEVSCEFKEQ